MFCRILSYICDKGYRAMFEVTGAQIANLNDTDLRTLVALLAIAELRGQGYPTLRRSS